MKESAMQYSRVYLTKYLASGSRTVDEVAARLTAAADELRAMQAAGVIGDAGSAASDYPLLTTDDPQVAERFGFEPPEEADDD
jgi:hypothetical protein